MGKHLLKKAEKKGCGGKPSDFPKERAYIF